MVSVKVVQSDEGFLHEMEKAGSKLIIIDFHATWCGPCKRIAPVFEQQCKNYPQVVFLKVDVDICPETAEKFQITAMPTFVFIKEGKKIDELRGGDPNSLIEKIKKVSGAVGGAQEPDSDVTGHTDLSGYITLSGCNCLNESDENPHPNVFKKDKSFLQSDCDDQLLLTITFSQAVKIHSLKIDAALDGSGPKQMKLFVNLPNALGFEEAEGMEGVQSIVLQHDDITGEKLIPLRFVKFQNVSNLIVFIASNQGDKEITVINYLKVIGSPVEATNMNDFKRIAGKAGESH